MEFKEIAKILGLKEREVKVIYKNAIRKLSSPQFKELRDLLKYGG